jgi:hypothetical protein
MVNSDPTGPFADPPHKKCLNASITGSLRFAGLSASKEADRAHA